VGIPVVAVIVVVVVVVMAVGAAAGVRVSRPLPNAVLTSKLPRSIPVRGPKPNLPWPIVGQGAVSIPTLGYASQSGRETSVPIASLTKMTTAVVILRNHPLPNGSNGPMITVTPGDAAQYDVDLDNDESSIPIQAGEVLSERQMLEAMMNQSANDVAYTLAVWDAGSLPAFVAKMNALAASLHATQTHYVDASGYDPQSVSTASDCLRIAAAGMSIPAFAQIVSLPTVTLPLVGTVHNIVTQIGSDGVVGVKSGYTSQADACMVLAAYRIIDGRSVLVLASVLGQHVPPPPMNPEVVVGGSALQYPLLYAGPLDEQLLDATEAIVVRQVVVNPGEQLAWAAAVWGDESHRVPVIATRGVWLLGVPGQRVAAAERFSTVPGGARAGHSAGSALYSLGAQIEMVPMVATATLPEPSWQWRLLHG
jgi:serine-type D-Ala-D-Ala carboxypeptidase (penicillin-binding protein 5/6)